MVEYNSGDAEERIQDLEEDLDKAIKLLAKWVEIHKNVRSGLPSKLLPETIKLVGSVPEAGIKRSSKV